MQKDTPTPAEPPDAKPKPPPYSLPSQLRPVAPGNVVRSDTAIAFYESPVNGESGSTVASMLLASYKVIPELAPMVRVGMVSNSPPGATAPAADPDSGFNFINPVVGATYGPNIGKSVKLGLFLGMTIPVGMGGGDTPEPGNALANTAGMAARSAMDNAMFAVNYFTVFPGVGFAFVESGFTAQVEVTVLQLFKTRGPDTLDESNTNLTTGVHLGYFVLPMLSVGGEVRHQRWISTPAGIKEGGGMPPRTADQESTLRDTTTFAVGPRFHIKLNDKMWLRPGIAFAMPIDKPLSDAKYRVAQLDVPLAF